MLITLDNNFKIEYEQLLKAYNGGHYAMVLIKNVTTTIEGDQYLRAQHYTILTKVVDEVIQICILQLHSKLSSVQPTFKEVNSYLFRCIIFFTNLHIKHKIEFNVHFMIDYKNYFCFFCFYNKFGYHLLKERSLFRKKRIGLGT